MFPWRSASDGSEATPTVQLNPYSGGWMRDPTRRQRHVGAAIARNVWHHALCTGDEHFLAGPGGEMLVEIARFWASLARFDPALCRWRIRGVIGPDEYHTAYPGAAEPGLDDNAYTNLMAAWTLDRARDALALLPPRRRAEFREDMRLDDAEEALWERVARGLRVPFLHDGVIEQFDGFGSLRPADPEKMRARHGGRRLDWALAAEGDTADAYQLTKQADVLMLLHLLPCDELIGTFARMGYAVTEADLGRTAAYYLARDTRASSLSATACAGALARLDPAASWRFFCGAMRPDCGPARAASTAEGLHVGAMAGMLDVLQRHYLGVRPDAAGLRLDPAPPAELGPVRTRLRVRGGDYDLAWDGAAVRLLADAGNTAPLAVTSRGDTRVLRPGAEIAVRADRE